MKKFIYELFYKIKIITKVFIFILFFMFLSGDISEIFEDISVNYLNFFFQIVDYQSDFIEFDNHELLEISEDDESELEECINIQNEFLFNIVLSIYFTSIYMLNRDRKNERNSHNATF